MSRSQSQHTRDKNKATLPQVPNNAKVHPDNQEEVELAKELDQMYELEVKPGFEPTGVRRKEK